MASGSASCPHCGMSNRTGSSFCESCGKALPLANPSGPAVVNPYTAATSAGQNVQSEALRKSANSAFGALLAVAILQTVAGVVIYFLVKDQLKAGNDAATIVVGVVFGVAVVFFGLAVWARSNPLPAAIVGLVLYVSLTLLDAAVDPASIARGIIFKVIIVVALVKGIQAGIQHRDLRRRMSKNYY